MPQLMQARLLTVVLLISVLSDWPLTTAAAEAANLASAKSRAKRAIAKFYQDDEQATTQGLPLDDHGLVLVPAEEDLVKKPRCKRSEDTDRVSKYKRLSHSVHVQSDIRYRYATTLVTSKVKNPESRSREIFLTVILPDTAFISRFAIELDGKFFFGKVQKKENAWLEYQEAVSEGRTAGHVGISARHSNQFRVSVNTQAKSAVTFFLLFEELLQRKKGIYEHIINLTPRQKLKDFGIDVQIMENRPLKDLSVPGLKRRGITLTNTTKSNLDGTHILKDPSNPGAARISYRPRLESLQHLLKSNHALQFSVKYDVDRQSDKAGEIQVTDGYFAHFVAPENLPPMAKHVVFVLDVSGSMNGKKLIQVKNAMKSILNQLRDIDFFSILHFSDVVTEWRLEATAATKESLEAAKLYVEGMEASGGTNIYQGLKTGLQRIREASNSSTVVQPMMIFLTDGHATSGVTEKKAILTDVQAANADLNVPVFCLSFGRFADSSLLKTLSLQNYAFTRKIYSASDASLQLEGFYKEVSSPILRGVQFNYQADEILANSLTSTNFHTYYQGSEMIVAGKLASDQPIDQKFSFPMSDTTDAGKLIEYEILATEANGQYRVDGKYEAASKAEFYPQTITETVFDVFPPSASVIKEASDRRTCSSSGCNYLERLWAYLTIRDLYEKVARGDLNSCKNSRAKRSARIDAIKPIDDEDYDLLEGSDYDQLEGSGVSKDQDLDYGMEDYEEEEVDGMWDDENMVICDNIERALFLSLKYEFVTPLTSLVVSVPEATKEGALSEAIGGHNRRHTITFSSAYSFADGTQHLLCLIVAFLIVFQ